MSGVEGSGGGRGASGMQEPSVGVLGPVEGRVSYYWCDIIRFALELELGLAHEVFPEALRRVREGVKVPLAVLGEVCRETARGGIWEAVGDG